MASRPFQSEESVLPCCRAEGRSLSPGPREKADAHSPDQGMIRHVWVHSLLLRDMPRSLRCFGHCGLIPSGLIPNDFHSLISRVYKV